jgi:hypothetical protein
MVLIDFTQRFIDFDTGKEVESPMENEDYLTLGSITTRALMTTLEGDKDDGDKKLDRYILATKIKVEGKDGAIDIESKEIQQIKALVGGMYSIVIVGQAFPMLEGKEPEKVDE